MGFCCFWVRDFGFEKCSGFCVRFWKFSLCSMVGFLCFWIRGLRKSVSFD
jgi:hypothetical protein